MASVNQLLNSPESLVAEAIDGLVAASPQLRRLDGFPDIKVVYNAEHNKQSHVAVISGGGSGHEPAHAGYVGTGMLAAAVAGEVFASPSAESVLAAIRAVTGPPGCLLVVKNYTGDRLHFGLAAERAKSEGYAVEMVVVGDDVAIDKPGLAGRRGLAGTVLVHKVAGAAAASGASLQEVAALAQAAASNLATLGVALRVCTLPGKAPSDRLGPGEIEIGLGIHGEPGAIKTAAMPARALVDRMLAHIAASPHFPSLFSQPPTTAQSDSTVGQSPSQRLVLLVNNLGSTPSLELQLVVKEALRALEGRFQAAVERVYAGPFMTSLDMAGMSLTLMHIEEGEAGDKLLSLLDAPTAAPAWPYRGPATVNRSAPTAVPAGPEDAAPGAVQQQQPAAAAAAAAAEDPSALGAAIASAARALIDAAPQIDELDRKVGDGDCGDTLALGARAILADLPRYPLRDSAATAAAVAASVRRAVGGSSGALYDILLSAAARSLQADGSSSSSSAGPADVVSRWARALHAGLEAVQRYGGARGGCRTMLDALLPACDALEDAAQEGLSAPQAAARAAQAAQAGAESTKDMAAAAGRASYVPREVLAQVPDPGAVGAATWLAAVAEALK